MKIGILQTGHVPEPLAARHGSYPAMFERLLDGHGFTFETYVVVDGAFPADIHASDAYLITGSAHGAYEDHPWIPRLETFIRDCYAAGIPIAGICFGHQIMAQALGGRVEKFAGGWGLGQTSYRMSDRIRDVLALHQDQVVEKPPEAKVIASTDFCANAGFAYRGRAISFQPHPEFSPAYMRDLIAYKIGKGISKEEADRALAALREENDAPEIALQLAEFFKAAKADKAA